MNTCTMKPHSILTVLPPSHVGWVDVGWQRRCKTHQSLRELDNQGTVSFFLVMAGGRVTVDHFFGVENLNSAQGE